MDNRIRSLLVTAQKFKGYEKNSSLQQAYGLLRKVAETRPTVDAPESFGVDLYVQCAEIAFRNGQVNMAKECLKMFFMKPPPANQFLCRAYLCQAQLIAPKNANNPEQLDKAVVYLLKAISFAKTTPSYHFLVYNASVLYWQFCRPFLKPLFRQYLARSLHQVVKALDDIDDRDYEWRAQLMIALIECHLDAGRSSDASHITTAAASFIKVHVPSLYKQVFGLMVRHQLIDPVKFQKEVKASPELSVYYKICKLKVSSEKGEAKEYYSEIQSILNLMEVPHIPADVCGGPFSLQINVTSSRPKSPVISPTSGKEKDDELLQGVPPEKRKSPTKGGSRRTPTPTSTKKIAVDSLDKPYLLLELARYCLELDFADLAEDCVDYTKTCFIKEPSFYLELEFLHCELMVKSLAEKQESYQKSFVEVRLKAIKRCEEAIMNAIRSGNPNVIQAGCVTQWNLCLPLLQANLRHHVRKPLIIVAEALSDIQSLLIQLRCQVHTELTKCEEDREQIQVAMDHLRKALELDDGSVYKERLEVALHRLELRSELYKQPERAEDQAAMIIEQARTADSGTIRMKRSLLVKAGEALAPDAFLLVLDSESETKGIGGGRGPLTLIRQMCGRAQQFTEGIKKAEGHLKRLGNENERERVRLWADLAKTARKQEVWDVCRVASRFCLLYDDGRWRNVSESPKVERMKTSEFKEKEEEEKKSAISGSRPISPDMGVRLYDKDLIRILAEVNFVQGEALVHLLRTEGVQLNDTPIPPEDKSKHPKGYVAKKPEEDPDWIEYCDWIKSLSESSTASFLRGLALGTELDEPWLVCSAAAYIWNYNNHIFTQNRHREVIDTLLEVLEGLKKVGHAGEIVMLVNICNAFSYGLLKPWIPVFAVKDERPVSPPPSEKSPRGKAKQAAVSSRGAKPQGIIINPDAMPDLKKAIEVCEHVMRVTNGDNPQDVVSIFVRNPILKTWVFAKQLSQSQITKSFGTDDETSTEGQRPMTRAIVATEMLSLNKNEIMEFKDLPPMSDIAHMIEECDWSDKFIELQLWTRMTYMAYQARAHNLVMRCSKKALRFAATGTMPKGKKGETCFSHVAFMTAIHCIQVSKKGRGEGAEEVLGRGSGNVRHRAQEGHHYIVEQEMLSYSSGLLGQSLIDIMAGKNAIRREAMEAFLNSARFACNATNYELVMTAARHYWNACITLVSHPIERELLREPIRTILECITATCDKPKKEDKSSEHTESETKSDGDPAKTEVKIDTKDAKDGKKQKSSDMIGNPEEDLTLRAALYGVLFMSYIDKKQWKTALQAMDQAIDNMPRTKHRLLIFKHRVMVKAKLGQMVYTDIQKFKDESEDYVAHMWRRVAVSSRKPLEQMCSYQLAIEALNSPSNEWLKVEYLVEFGQWLYVNNFPLQDSVDQIEWAADILLNMKSDLPPPPEKKDSDTSIESIAEPVVNSSKAKGSNMMGELKKVPPKAAIKVVKGNKKSPAPKKGAARKVSGKSKTSEQKLPEVTKKVEPEEKLEEKPEEKPVSEVSDADSEINAADYIPVVKETEIGVLPANTSLTMADVMDIKQLDMLIRVHVVLAQVSGPASQCYRDTCLIAYGYLIQLWNMCLSSSGPVLREIARNPVPETAASGKSSTKPPKGKHAKEEEKIPKNKPQRNGPLEVPPSTTEDWAQYDIPDEVLEAFNHETMKKTGINSETIEKPMLSLHILDTLMTMLTGIGYHQLVLPILAFEDLLSRTLLKNNALHVLIHIKAIEVCQQLDLPQGCHFHDRLINGQLHINEDDQAMSRTEIAILKEKQVQVAKEEMRVQESLALRPVEGSAKDEYQPEPQTNQTEQKEDVVESHLGKVLGAVTYRDVWTDTAEILIRQGLYQNARDLLSEAHTAALEFDDKSLQGRILYLFGLLAFKEAQFQQAMNLCRAAQDVYEGDEMYWFNTTMLMIEGTHHDYENRYGSRVARKIVVDALNEFMSIYEERPNRISVTGYILATLEGKLASIQSSILLKKNVNAPAIMEGLLSCCERFETSSDRLIKLGYKREAVPLMKEHAGILRLLARQALENEIKHTYYLQSLLVLRDAVYHAEDVFQDVQSLCPLDNNRCLSFPVQREFADIQIETAELLLEILQLHDKERRMKQLIDDRKGSVVKMVESLISQTPVYTHMEKEWVEIKHTCGEEAISKLLSAFNLAGNIPRLRARALCSLGWGLKLLSLLKGYDAPPHWLVHEMDLLKTNTETESNEGEEPEDFDDPPDKEEKAFRKYSSIIKNMKKMHQDSKFYLLQSTECLVQCINLSLPNKFIDLASRAALELVDCFGQFDPNTASNFLALHQSCETSLQLEEILNISQPDPTTSKLAALLNQRKNLIQNDIKTNLTKGQLMYSIDISLHTDWQCWKRIDVIPNYLDLLREFPSNFNFVILQHTPDKSFLYGSLLDKPGKSGGTAAGGKAPQKQQFSHVPSRAKIFGTETSARLLDELVSKFKQHKQSVQQMLLKLEYQRTQAALRNKMLQNLDSGVKKQESKLMFDGEDQDEENRLQEEFRELVAAMECYLKPVMEPIETALELNSIEREKDSSTECLILLADPELMQMPLEALECLSAKLVTSCSRDFSLQLFYHRYHVEHSVDEPVVEKKKKAKGTDQDIMSRIPGAREVKQKISKLIPLNRHVEPWQISVDTMNFKYILDIHLDCSETEENKPIEQFQKVLNHYEQQFTPRWLGISGNDHPPSVGEWEVYLSESSSFIFYGMERLLSYIPPSKLSALNIPDCTMLYLLDLAQTSKSFLRQAKVDVLKSENNLALEKPLETAQLASLTGVKCIMMNQWHCTLAENKERFHLTMKDMLEKGKTSGQAVQLLCSPKKRKQEEAEMAESEEGDYPDNNKNSNDGSHKGDHSHSRRDSNKTTESISLESGVSPEPGQEAAFDPDKDLEEPKEDEELPIERSWFNMVCYGLPNIIVTQ